MDINDIRIAKILISMSLLGILSIWALRSGLLSDSEVIWITGLLGYWIGTYSNRKQ